MGSLENPGKVESADRPASGPSLGELADQIGQLAAFAGSTPDGEGFFDLDPGFQRRFRELEIDLLGLQALELRLLPEGAEPARRHVLLDVLACRAAELADRVAELTLECLGYYGLPFPDPLLIDNEGPIGHHWALPAMRALQAYFEPSGLEGFERRHRLAGRLFNH